MSIARLILLVIAAVCFLLAGLNVQARYNLLGFGLFCLALASLPIYSTP